MKKFILRYRRPRACPGEEQMQKDIVSLVFSANHWAAVLDDKVYWAHRFNTEGVKETLTGVVELLDGMNSNLVNAVRTFKDIHGNVLEQFDEDEGNYEWDCPKSKEHAYNFDKTCFASETALQRIKSARLDLSVALTDWDVSRCNEDVFFADYFSKFTDIHTAVLNAKRQVEEFIKTYGKRKVDRSCATHPRAKKTK